MVPVFTCFRPRASAGLMLAVLALLASPTQAQDSSDEVVFPEFSGSVALVSDYRFRGTSFSDRGVAIQPYLQMATASGFLVSVWGSSIAEYNGATTEIDVTAGWSGSIAGLSTSVGVLGYLYPGGAGTDIVEFYGSVGLPLGPLSATLGLNWAPDQKNLSRSNRYAYASLSAGLPGIPVTLSALAGNERGSFVIDEADGKSSKWDWQVGATYSLDPLAIGIAYVGNNLSNRTIDFGEGVSGRAKRTARDTILISLTASF